MNNDNNGCLAVIIGILLILGIVFAVYYFLTKLVCWISLGLFDYPLDDKFWYIFATLVVIHTVLGGYRKIDIRR